VNTKKKLITRMAAGAAAVLVGALFLGGVALVRDHSDRQRWEARQKSERQEAVDRSRRYLAELAKRVTQLPVDPALVAEIESRYFDEQAGGTMRVWAMGTDGAFLFGVPKESFSRLNALYDREVAPRIKDGAFLDRQSFLLGNLDEGEELARIAAGDGTAEEPADLLARLRSYAERSDRDFVLSVPLRTAEGVALGSLYLKRALAEHEWYRRDERLELLADGSGGVAGLAFAFLWILLPTWVYVDGRERGVRRAPLFAFLTVLSSVLGLVVYLIARPEDGRTLACPGCAREVNGGAFCPHCGRDLSASFCSTCRYPLQPDWTFCPSCRTEIKVAATAAAEAPAAG
jgi:hypothetical protein